MSDTTALGICEGAEGVCPDAGVKLLEVECADLEHKAHPALDKLTVRVGDLHRALLYSASASFVLSSSLSGHTIISRGQKK